MSTRPNLFPTLSRFLALSALLVLIDGPTSLALAQDKARTPGGGDVKGPQKDDALDALLKTLDRAGSGDTKTPAPTPAPDQPRAGEKAKATAKDKTKAAAEPAKSAAPGETRPSGRDTSAEKPGGEVAPKDKALDSLLEKLGETDDRPSAEEKSPGGPGGDPKPGDDDTTAKGPKTDQPDALTGKSKALDEVLEGLAGKRKKAKKPQEEGGALGEVIKEMRDVEERLGKSETGEETRKKQAEIVKRIETLIEQSRQSSSRSQTRPRKGMAMNGGPPNGQPSETPGNTGGNAPHAKPKDKDAPTFNGSKDAWGHLPPDLRQELDNVFKEEPLPARQELIRRYYLSVTKKAVNRGE